MSDLPANALPDAALRSDDLAPDTAPAPAHTPPQRRSSRGPTLGDRLWTAVILAVKGITLACGVDAVLNDRSKRLRGKGIRTRAIGYVGGLFVVPIAWRLLPDRGRYPRELDLAVSVPLLLDAGGNALGMYEKAHLDDAVHVANSAILSGVAGALFAPRVDERWQAALAAAGVAVAAGSLWEICEYIGWRLGADGMNLTYPDTMEDLIEDFAGAALGGLFTLTRTPRPKHERARAGWRAPLGA